MLLPHLEMNIGIGNVVWHVNITVIAFKTQPHDSSTFLWFMLSLSGTHDDVIKWKHFPHYWPFVRGIHRSPVNSQHKGQWRGALMFSLICALNKRLSIQSWGWWFETPSHPLWRHFNVKCNTWNTSSPMSKHNVWNVPDFLIIIHIALSLCFGIISLALGNPTIAPDMGIWMHISLIITIALPEQILCVSKDVRRTCSLVKEGMKSWAHNKANTRPASEH